MANFVGKWKLDKVDNLDGFMKSMGAPPELIKKALENQDKHNIEISNSGNKWNIKSDTMKMNHEFELGKQVEETGPCGRSTKNITRMDGNKLITDARYEDGKVLHIERWIERGRLMVTMKNGNTICRHEFVKV